MLAATMRFRVIAATLAVVAAVAGPAGAVETNCTVCMPPTGRLGYVWFTLVNNTSFTCQTGSQTITQSYGSALAGFKPDGTLAVIRFTASNVTREVLITGATVCTVRL